MKAYELCNQPDAPWIGVDRAMPEPTARQVLIKVHAAALNYRDVLIAKGLYGIRNENPITPLSDGAGEVVAVGDEVTRVQVGDRVAGIFFQQFLNGKLTREKSLSALGGNLSGMLAEYVVLDQDGVVKIPAHLSYEEAATLPCAAVTAWNALIAEGHLQAGQTVLLLGTGGVSIFALQFAKLMGARVLITSSQDEKLARTQTMGADIGINYKTTPNWDETVWELTNKQGVDYVVEVGGANTLNQSLRAVGYGGMVALIGVLSGAKGDINTALILQKHLRVQGIYVGSRETFEAMNRAIAQAKLRPVIDRVFPFDQAIAALTYLESGSHFGKVVIKIA